MAQLALISKLW